MGIGEGFGEKALISKTAKRTTSILMNEPTEFITIDKEDYLNIVRGFDQKRINKIDFLRKHIPHLSNIASAEVWDDMFFMIKDHVFPKGTLISEEDTPGTHLYFLMQGTCEVEKNVTVFVHPEKKNEKIEIIQTKKVFATLARGAVIGEEIMTSSSVYKYTVRVTSGIVQILAITKREIVKLPPETVFAIANNYKAKEEFYKGKIAEFQEDYAEEVRLKRKDEAMIKDKKIVDFVVPSLKNRFKTFLKQQQSNILSEASAPQITDPDAPILTEEEAFVNLVKEVTKNINSRALPETNPQRIKNKFCTIYSTQPGNRPVPKLVDKTWVPKAKDSKRGAPQSISNLNYERFLELHQPDLDPIQRVSSPIKRLITLEDNVNFGYTRVADLEDKCSIKPVTLAKLAEARKNQKYVPKRVKKQQEMQFSSPSISPSPSRTISPIHREQSPRRSTITSDTFAQRSASVPRLTNIHKTPDSSPSPQRKGSRSPLKSLFQIQMIPTPEPESKFTTTLRETLRSTNIMGSIKKIRSDSNLNKKANNGMHIRSLKNFIGPMLDGRRSLTTFTTQAESEMNYGYTDRKIQCDEDDGGNEDKDIKRIISSLAKPLNPLQIKRNNADSLNSKKQRVKVIVKALPQFIEADKNKVAGWFKGIKPGK